MSPPLGKGLSTGFNNIGWGIEIRFANFKMHDISPL
jgi:hypothetical protein